MRCSRQSLDARKRFMSWRHNFRRLPTTTSGWPPCPAGASAHPQLLRSARCTFLPRTACVAPSTASPSAVMSGVHPNRTHRHSVAADRLADHGKGRGALRAPTGTACSTIANSRASFLATELLRSLTSRDTRCVSPQLGNSNWSPRNAGDLLDGNEGPGPSSAPQLHLVNLERHHEL